MIITPKNWHEFQHYKNRCPPWIKLHRTILDNYEFHMLPDASKALAMCLWLLASEGENGEIDADYEKLAFRFRTTAKKIEESLKPLINNGFFNVLHDDSDMLADSKQDATLEKSREEKEKRKREITLAQFFEECNLKNELAITDNDPIFEYADKIGIPQDFMRLGWEAFKRKQKPLKKQADWRSVFRNYVRSGWLDVWAINATGEFYLTTYGKQLEKELGVTG